MKVDSALPAADFPNRQEFYRHAYQRIRPGWKDSQALYIDIVERYVGSDTHVLDIGCGHGDFLRAVYARTPHTYGIDPDAEALAKNTIIRHPIVGSAEQLPFAESSFDLVVSAWVLEHLEDPVQAFREIYRVLKPGGTVVCLTPNAWNYNVWLIRMIPNRFHDFFTRRLYGRQERDTYRVRYRINSPGKLRRTLTRLGFKQVQLITNGDPTYISFNRPLFFFARCLEALLDLKFLRFARVHIIGVYEK